MAEAAGGASADVQLLEALSICSHHIDKTKRLPSEISHTHEAAAAEADVTDRQKQPTEQSK